MLFFVKINIYVLYFALLTWTPSQKCLPGTDRFSNKKLSIFQNRLRTIISKNLENEQRKGKTTTKTNCIFGILRVLKEKCGCFCYTASLIFYMHISLYHFHIILLLFHLLSFTALATRHVLQFKTFDSI